MSNLPFIKLGRGAQFHSFDMHNGRVLKIPLTEAETFAVAKQRHNVIHGTLEEIATLDVRVQTFMNSKARIPAMVDHQFLNPAPFLALLGNPQVLNSNTLLPEDTPFKKWGPGRVVYTQDKLDIVKHWLAYLRDQSNISTRDKKRFTKLIEDYIQHVYSLWEYGYGEYVFKLGDMGLDAKGRLRTVDLGEFTSDSTFLERALEERWWQDNINPHKTDFPKMPSELEPLYVQLMSDALTPAELAKRWRTKHECTMCNSETTTIAAFVSTTVSEIDYIDRL